MDDLQEEIIQRWTLVYQEADPGNAKGWGRKLLFSLSNGTILLL